MTTYQARTRRWTRIEYEKLVDLGIFRPGEAVELIGRELIVSEPQGALHYAAILKRYTRREVFRPAAEVRPLATPSAAIRVVDLLP